MIIKSIVVGQFGSNCYIVGSDSGREGIIIDPGDEADKILDAVKASGLDIKMIVITHGHIDHVSAVKEVKEATGAEVAIHADDAGFLQDGRAALFFDISYPVSPPDRLLKGGDSIDVGGLHFEVIHTPGHSPGGICLLGEGVLFSGDTLFNFGIGRYDFPGSSGSQLAESLRQLMTLPDEVIVYPGHGPDTTIGAERRGNPFLRDFRL